MPGTREQHYLLDHAEPGLMFLSTSHPDIGCVAGYCTNVVTHVVAKPEPAHQEGTGGKLISLLDG